MSSSLKYTVASGTTENWGSVGVEKASMQLAETMIQQQTVGKNGFRSRLKEGKEAKKAEKEKLAKLKIRDGEQKKKQKEKHKLKKIEEKEALIETKKKGKKTRVAKRGKKAEPKRKSGGKRTKNNHPVKRKK